MNVRKDEEDGAPEEDSMTANEGIANHEEDGKTNTQGEAGGEQAKRLRRGTKPSSATSVQSQEGTDSVYPSGPG